MTDRTRRASMLLYWRALMLLAAAAVVGCAPMADVEVTPKRVTLVAGGQATVRVTATTSCEDPPCFDPGGRVFEYVLSNLPAGVTYTLDTSLQSPSTPSVVSITFAAAPDIAAENHANVILQTVVEGRVLSTNTIGLRVMPAVPPQPLPAAAKVAAGTQFSLALLAGGEVASWGRNDLGQLANGHRGPQTTPGLIPGLPRIAALAAGPGHALALAETGEVWAWGDNAESQLGPVDATALSTPARVGTLTNIRAVAAGYYHSLAVDAAGDVWAWGNNHRGALGENGGRRTPTPVRVPGLPPMQAVAAGAHASFALGTDGTVWAWGDTIGTFTWSSVPHQVPGLENIRSISATSHAALAVDEDGHVWGWGDNALGRLGTGGEGDNIPTPVRIDGPANVVAAAAGNSSSLAVSATGEVWQWGRGKPVHVDPATLVPRIVAELNDVAAIAVGENHFLATLRCGQVWAWGLNGHRQLGSDVDVEAATPQLVDGIGSGEGCARVKLRLFVGGDTPPMPFDAGDVGGAPWPGEPYTTLLARGTPVSISARHSLSGEGNVFAFDGWAGDCGGGEPDITVVLDRSKACTALYDRITPDPVLLSVVSNGGDVASSSGGILGPARIACGDTCAAVFPRETSVTLRATPAPGFAFASWGDACSGTLRDATVRMDGAKTCVAHYQPYQLELTIAGDGRVISDPAGIDCGSICSMEPRVGSVRLAAIPALGWSVATWGGDCAGTTADIDVTMIRDRRCTVAFERVPDTFLLTVVVDGQGIVTSQPGGISCPGACTALFPAGTQVALTAQPGTGWQVSAWVEDCPAAASPVRQVIVDRDLRCRARITPQAAVPVARFTSSIPVHIGIHVGDVVMFNGLESHMFDPATGTENREAIRSLAWDLDSDGVLDEATGSRAAAGIVQYAFQDAGSFPVRLRVEGGPFDFHDTLERSFTILPATDPLHELTVVKTGAGRGTVVTSPQGLLACDESCGMVGPILVEELATIAVVAQPAPGSTFVGWSGNGCTDASPAIEIEMSESRTCAARFVPEEVMLSVTSGSGGSVTSSPPGILCGADCSELVSTGTAVVLTATPDPGFEIDGWAGCDIVAGDQCTVAMLSPRTAAVTFRPTGLFTLTVVLSGPAGSFGRVISLVPVGAIDCGISFGSTCAVTAPAGTLIVLRPDDLALETNLFSSWSGCDVVGSLFTCNVTVTGNRTIVATFRP